MDTQNVRVRYLSPHGQLALGREYHHVQWLFKITIAVPSINVWRCGDCIRIVLESPGTSKIVQDKVIIKCVRNVKCIFPCHLRAICRVTPTFVKLKKGKTKQKKTKKYLLLGSAFTFENESSRLGNISLFNNIFIEWHNLIMLISRSYTIDVQPPPISVTELVSQVYITTFPDNMVQQGLTTMVWPRCLSCLVVSIPICLHYYV